MVRRALPYWEAAIVPDLRDTAEHGGAVLVAAHGNSIRGPAQAPRGDLRRGDHRARDPDRHSPTGCCLDDDLTVRSADYLGDPEAAAAAAAAVARQADQPIG